MNRAGKIRHDNSPKAVDSFQDSGIYFPLTAGYKLFVYANMAKMGYFLYLHIV